MPLEDGWLVFATLGEMNLKNILDECQKGSWVPILVFRDEEKTLVPVLDTQEKAIRFAQRNLAKNQLFGTVILTEEDSKKIRQEFSSKGLIFEFLDHPRRMRGRADVEIYEFFGSPDIYGVGKGMSMSSISYSIEGG